MQTECQLQVSSTLTAPVRTRLSKETKILFCTLFSLTIHTDMPGYTKSVK